MLLWPPPAGPGAGVILGQQTRVTVMFSSWKSVVNWDWVVLTKLTVLSAFGSDTTKDEVNVVLWVSTPKATVAKLPPLGKSTPLIRGRMPMVTVVGTGVVPRTRLAEALTL